MLLDNKIQLRYLEFELLSLSKLFLPTKDISLTLDERIHSEKIFALCSYSISSFIIFLHFISKKAKELLFLSDLVSIIICPSISVFMRLILTQTKVFVSIANLSNGVKLRLLNFLLGEVVVILWFTLQVFAGRGLSMFSKVLKKRHICKGFYK